MRTLRNIYTSYCPSNPSMLIAEQNKWICGLAKDAVLDYEARSLVDGQPDQSEIASLQEQVKICEDALEKNVDLVPLGERRDCTGCDYDGYINQNHHRECIHVSLSEGLSKLHALRVQGKEGRKE